MRLLEGNCLEKLAEIEDDSVQLVILDLPYGQTDCEWDNKIDLDQLWIQLKRIGKDNTAYIFFCTAKFGYDLITANKKWFRYDLIWYKPNSNAGFLNARKMPMRNFETLYVFYNKLPIYNIEEHHQLTGKTDTNKLKNKGSVYSANPNLTHSTGRMWTPPLPKSVIQIDSNMNRRNQNHPTEKPIEILEWIIKYYSKEGDIVLDPTMGSGSTGVACLNLKRDFIGIELSKEFYDIACQRCSYQPE